MTAFANKHETRAVYWICHNKNSISDPRFSQPLRAVHDEYILTIWQSVRNYLTELIRCIAVCRRLLLRYS